MASTSTQETVELSLLRKSGRCGFTARLPLLYCGLLAQYGIGAARLQIQWSMHCEATALWLEGARMSVRLLTSVRVTGTTLCSSVWPCSRDHVEHANWLRHMEKSTILSKRAASVKIPITFYQVPTYRHGNFGLLAESGCGIVPFGVEPWRWSQERHWLCVPG